MEQILVCTVAFTSLIFLNIFLFSFQWSWMPNLLVMVNLLLLCLNAWKLEDHCGLVHSYGCFTVLHGVHSHFAASVMYIHEFLTLHRYVKQKESCSYRNMMKPNVCLVVCQGDEEIVIVVKGCCQVYNELKYECIFS